MSTFILVHGAWHGAWCWENIIPLLEKEGHTVYAIDLPSHGLDQTPVSHVTLDSYTDKVCSAIDQAQEPVILVGHSMGGMVISQTAEYRAEKIEKLVYVTAFLLENGQSMMDHIQKDTDAIVAPNLVVSEDGVHARVREEALPEVFYNECNASDIVRIKPLLTDQAVQVLATPLQLSEEQFGSIPRYYIECTKDNAITNSCQKNMYTNTPCQEIFTLNTDHSPFYSKPAELAAILEGISQKVLDKTL